MEHEWAQRLILAVRKVREEAVVAGGFMRDIRNGRPVKDVDIFVRPLNHNEYAEFTGLINVTHPDPEPRTLDGDEYFEWEPWVKRTTEYQSDDGWPAVNLIEIDIPRGLPFTETLLNRFDFGLCRIAWDGDGVLTTVDYMHDADNQIITLRRCENMEQFVRSMQRYERLRQKYEWPLVILEEHAKFDKQHREEEAMLDDLLRDLLPWPTDTNASRSGASLLAAPTP